MKLAEFPAFSKEEDIQIQTSVSAIDVEVFLPNGVLLNEGNVEVRLNYVSSTKGTSTIINKIGLLTLFEEAAGRKGQGYFELETSTDPDDNWVTRGTIQISDSGALAAGSDGYLSLDVIGHLANPAHTIKGLSLHGLGAPNMTSTYIRRNPVTVQGVAKEIPLAGVKTLLLRPDDIDTLTLVYPGGSYPYTAYELRAMARQLNDLVFVNLTNSNTIHGLHRYMVLNVENALRCVVEPAAGGQFTMYLNEDKSL